MLVDQSNDTLDTVSFTNSSTLKFVVNNLQPGVYTCTIVYPGDANHTAANSTPFTVRVTVAQTTTALNVSSSRLYYGEPLTLTATVSSPGGGPSSTPHSGSITFMSGKVDLGTVNLANNSANLTIPNPAVGSHGYTAVYSGDSNYKPDNSPNRSVNVMRDNTQAVLLSSAGGPVAPGVPFALTATVTSLLVGSAIPTGTITFKDGNKTLGTIALDPTGAAKLPISLSGIATHKLTARYSGDSLMAPIVSPTLLQVVAPTV
jgi:hypothetical protein